MLGKGKAFLAAAVLLKERGGDDFVVFHLFCQGLEIFLKGLLLYEDYDRYHPRLRQGFGHDLERLAAEAANAFSLHKPSGPLAAELSNMNSLYKKHLLRYASMVDVLRRLPSLSTTRVFRRTVALLRLADRHVQ